VQPSAFFMVDKVKKIKSHFLKLFFGLRVNSAPAVIWASLIFFLNGKIVDFILSGNHVASPPSPLLFFLPSTNWTRPKGWIRSGQRVFLQIEANDDSVVGANRRIPQCKE
jgi:hypothetical protein